MTRDAYDKEQQWEENKKKLEHPGYSYVRHTSDQYISGIKNASDGYAWGAMQVNIADLKGAMGEGSDYDDTALKRELEKQGKAIEANTDAIADKSDKDHTHPNITDPYDDAWIQPEIDKKSDKGHTHDISHNHDTEYQPVGDYADKNHLHNFDHTHDDYLTSDDLPDPYDDTQIRDDFAAADQNLQNQIDVINDAGYDDSGIKLSLALEEQARIAGDDALSGRIDGKADDGHTHDTTHSHDGDYAIEGHFHSNYATKHDHPYSMIDHEHDPIDLEHDHNLVYSAIDHLHTINEFVHDHDENYQPKGDYADTSHKHDADYQPLGNYADKEHDHPPQDLTHNHDSDYQPVGDYATNQTVAAGDQDLQDQIDAISSSGGYNDSWIEPAINAGDANTLSGANAYTDAEVAKIVLPDVSDFATTNYVDAGDAAVEAKIPDVSNFATNQELTDGLASKSDTTHDHDEFTHTHDFTHDHDGQYALEHDHPYAAGDHTHDTSHNHDGEYLTSDDLPDAYDDTQIKADLAKETADRDAADAELNKKIVGEENARYIADQGLQDQIDAIQSSGYDDTQLRADFAAADATTLASANTYTNEEVAKIIVPDVSDFSTTDYVDAGDATTLASSNTYTDKEIAKIDIPVVDDFATTDYVDAGDTTTLSSSKTYTDEEVAKIFVPDVSDLATKDELTTGLAGKADEPHTHDDLATGDHNHDADYASKTEFDTHTHDTSHDHSGQYQPVGDYATNSDLTGGLAEKSDTTHTHPPQDLTHDHFGEYAGKAEFDAHHHDEEYLTSDDLPDPYDDSAVKGLIANEETARVAGDQSLQNQIDNINNSGYDDSELRGLIQGNTDALDDKSDTTHSHPPQDLTHDHPDLFPSGVEADGDGKPIPLPYANANTLGKAVDGKAEEDHTHPPQDLTHNHNGIYSPTTHLHDDNYAEKTHEHDTSHTHTEYAETRHNHDGTYQPAGDYALDGHTHDTEHTHSDYFLVGDWSDSEFQPHADLRALDESYMELYDFSQKAQKLVDNQQDRRLDELEEHTHSEYSEITHSHDEFVALQNQIAALEERISALEGLVPNYGFDLGTFTLLADSGRPTGGAQTLDVASIWHSKVADCTTTPNNEVKLNNGNTDQVVEIAAHNGPVLVRFKQDARIQEWNSEDSGWTTNGNVLHISGLEISGNDLVAGREVHIFVELL